MSRRIDDAPALLARLRVVHAAIRDAVVEQCESAAVEQLAAVVAHEGGDTVFAVDRVAESVLLRHFARVAEQWPCVLVVEGLGDTGRVVLPAGTSEADALVRVIVDPIDGTRGLMYQKRSAWILTGVAPDRGDQTCLADITVALQTEIPLVKQHLSDSFWVVDGVIGGERYDRVSGTRTPLVPRPSQADTIEGGFGGLVRFFPGSRAVLAAVDDEVVEHLLGPPTTGRAQAFEDQYICTGGQLYELLMGHDRWVADLRPLLRAAGRTPGLCCHPYDMCTESIARAAGVRVTDESGGRLRAPLDVHTDVAWIGYANTALEDQVRPPLLGALRRHGLLGDGDGPDVAR